MKPTRSVLALAIALAGISASSAALAQYRHHHGPRVSIGIGFGVPFAPYPYFHPFYPVFPSYSYPVYYPAPVVVQQQPTVYIEQAQQAPQQPAGYWYYCNDARAYYPYVRDCPGGWQRVAPQPGN